MADVLKKAIPLLIDTFTKTSGESEQEITQRRKLEREQERFNFEMANRLARLEDRAESDKMAAPTWWFNRVDDRVVAVGRDLHITSEKTERNQADQSAFNRAISEEGALLKLRQSKLQTRTEELQSGQQKLQDELANTTAKVKVLENSTGEMRRLFHFVTMIFVFVIIFAYLLRA